MTLTRRDVFYALAAAIGGQAARLRSGQAAGPCSGEGPLGVLSGTVPLSGPDGVTQPLGVKLGSGLDARLFTDLSLLQPDRLITPTAQAYVRTECPASVAAARGAWRIATAGLVARPGALSLADLTRAARPMGSHLFECSGNSNPANFGLMSVAEWTGVPLADVVARLRPTYGSTGVLVSGVDPDRPSVTSEPGASWVLPLGSLDRLGAFLAVGMNGGALPPDHGAPVRLAVPGWYGCAWIKWVNEIRLVGPREPATPQMKEFASRTHQTAAHELAADYAPPAIETAAMPIRVEKRRTASGVQYRIVGIVWGGSRPIDRLAIRLGAGGSWTEFSVCPRATNIWSVWTFAWKPAAVGDYEIALRVPDRRVPQRRLDFGYYTRQVTIQER